MAEPTIPNGEEHFFPIIYEGNGAGQRVGKFVPFTDNGTIANSVIFNDGDTAYLDRTFGSGNQKIWTMSFWVKRCTLGAGQRIISRRTGGGSTTATMGFNSSNQFDFYDPSNGGEYITSRTFEDTSKFYHFLIRYEASNGTAGDRLQIYVDGDLQTFGTTGSIADTNGNFNANVVHAIGKYQYNNSEYFDGYLAEVNWIDGTNYGPETFGVTDTSTGRWVPKTLSGITYGTNGFRLTFQNNSAVANLGYDYQTSDRSTTNDFSVTNLATTDQTTDSPTQNHATINRNNKASTNASLSEGDLTVTLSSTYGGACAGMALPSSGKYYWEIKSTGTMDANTIVGIVPDNGVIIAGSQQFPGGSSNPDSFGFGPAQTSDAQTVHNSVFENCPTLSKTTAAGTYIQMCWDGNTGSLWFGLNDTFEGNPSAGTGASFTGINNTLKLFPACFAYTDVFEFNFGQRSFQYTPPTGFVALQQDNLPETAKGITGMSWTKDRDNSSTNHEMYDSSRGPFQELRSNTDTAENTRPQALSKFLKGGFAVGDRTGMNSSGNSYVSWNWVANSGTTESISAAGDIDIASTVQKNTTAGFSIVQWTGDNASTAGIGHGLSAAPEWILVKNLADTTDWFVYHKSVDADKTLKLNSTAVPGNFTTGKFDHSEIDATKFEVAQGGSNANSVNGSGDSMIAYCWHGVDGFSKFGSYTGNGNANGAFVYTGFRPAWIMFKETGNSNDWPIWDSARFPINPTNKSLFANLQQGDNSSSIDLDVCSNGFKCRTTNSQINRSNGSYIYMAFAEHPFIGDGTSPVTAR